MMGHVSDGLMVTLGVCTRDGSVTYTNSEFWQIKRAVAKLEDALEALRERAERVQEGEDWDLAEFIVRKTDALKKGS